MVALPVLPLTCWLFALEELCTTGATELLELMTGVTLLEEFTTGVVALLEELLSLVFPLLLEEVVVVLLFGATALED